MIYFCLPFFVLIGTTCSAVSFGDDGTYRITIGPKEKTMQVVGDVQHEQTVVMHNKKGQSFLCSIPEVQNQSQTEDFNMTTAEVVSALLPDEATVQSQMSASDCIRMPTNGWWHYEFCFHKEITQFHVENGVIKEPVLTLGYFDEDFNWDNVTAKEALRKPEREHIQYFRNGSMCDVIGKHREAKVKLSCNAKMVGIRDAILKVEEISSCIYEVTIFTKRLCHLDYFNKQPKHVGQIVCNPKVPEKTAEERNAEVEAEIASKAEAKKWTEGQQASQIPGLAKPGLEMAFKPRIKRLSSSTAIKPSAKQTEQEMADLMNSIFGQQQPKSRAQKLDDVLADMNPGHRRRKDIQRSIEERLGDLGAPIDVQIVGQAAGANAALLEMLEAPEIAKLKEIVLEAVEGEFRGMQEQEQVMSMEEGYHQEDVGSQKKKLKPFKKTRRVYKMEL